MHFLKWKVFGSSHIWIFLLHHLTCTFAQPVIVRETETANFRWMIPADESFSSVFVIAPNGPAVLQANANQYQLFGTYKNRVSYNGSLSNRIMAFELRDVRISDSGIYKCGTDSLADIIANCGQALIVLGQPTKPFLRGPSTPVFEQQVTLSCSANSTTVPTDNNLTLAYTWQRDNTDITVSSPGSSYLFTVESRNTHDYRCQARESQGLQSVWSDEYNLVPEYSPYDIFILPSSLSYTKTEGQGGVPSITCSAQCRPACSYRWYKGQTFSSNGATLNLGQAQRTQTGSYQCQATNKHGDTTSANVSVNITYPTGINNFTINSQTGLVTVDEGDRITLNCQVESNPESTIRFFNGTQQIARKDNSLLAVHDLEAGCRDRGEYSCRANNNIGTDDSFMVKLAVKCLPRLEKTLNPQFKYASALGGNVTVSVPVLAYPPPSFTWSRHSSTSQNLTGSLSRVSDILVNITCNLKHLQQQDFGIFTLTVENGVGDPVLFNINVVPQGPPVTPTNVSVLAKGPTSLLVAWKQEFNGGAVQNFSVEYKMDKEELWKIGETYVESKESEYLEISIGKLVPSTTYDLRLIAMNRFGSSNYTDIVSGRTHETAPVTSHTGIIAGVTLGTVTALVVVSAIVIWRKGCQCVVLRPDEEVVITRTTFEEPQGLTSAVSSMTESSFHSHYCELNRADADKQTYTELKTYMNVVSRPEPTYCNTHQDQAVTYENVNTNSFKSNPENRVVNEW